MSSTVPALGFNELLLLSLIMGPDRLGCDSWHQISHTHTHSRREWEWDTHTRIHTQRNVDSKRHAQVCTHIHVHNMTERQWECVCVTVCGCACASVYCSFGDGGAFAADNIFLQGIQSSILCLTKAGYVFLGLKFEGIATHTEHACARTPLQKQTPVGGNKIHRDQRLWLVFTAAASLSLTTVYLHTLINGLCVQWCVRVGSVCSFVLYM